VAEVLVVEAVADGVHLVLHREERPPVGAHVEEVQRPHEHGREEEDVQQEDAVRELAAGSALHEGDVVGHVEGQLRRGGRRVVVVVDHAVAELLGEARLPEPCR
jgi:hypothetical protein